MTFAGKVALVTGGSRGIGKAIAMELARRANLSEAEATSLAREAAREGSVVPLEAKLTPATHLYTLVGWTRLSGKAQQALAGFHAQNPLRQGMTREELRSRLGHAGHVQVRTDPPERRARVLALHVLPRARVDMPPRERLEGQRRRRVVARHTIVLDDEAAVAEGARVDGAPRALVEVLPEGRDHRVHPIAVGKPEKLATRDPEPGACE
mgnify:CR=1 FL=1